MHQCTPQQNKKLRYFIEEAIATIKAMNVSGIPYEPETHDTIATFEMCRPLPPSTKGGTR